MYQPRSVRSVVSLISYMQGIMLTAALTVLIVFEHLITTDHEIDLFWKRKFSGAAALFLTNRYLILVYSALTLMTSLDKSVSAEVSQADSHAGDSLWADTFAPP